MQSFRNFKFNFADNELKMNLCKRNMSDKILLINFVQPQCAINHLIKFQLLKGWKKYIIKI